MSSNKLLVSTTAGELTPGDVIVYDNEPQLVLYVHKFNLEERYPDIERLPRPWVEMLTYPNYAECQHNWSVGQGFTLKKISQEKK